jgi:hypothetical protein
MARLSAALCVQDEAGPPGARVERPARHGRNGSPGTTFAAWLYRRTTTRTPSHRCGGNVSDLLRRPDRCADPTAQAA